MKSIMGFHMDLYNSLYEGHNNCPLHGPYNSLYNYQNDGHVYGPYTSLKMTKMLAP
jgi:hypothetical protein